MIAWADANSFIHLPSDDVNHIALTYLKVAGVTAYLTTPQIAAGK